MPILPPYSTTFIAQRITAGVGAVDYTVPAGRTAVVNSVSFVQDVNTAQTILAASIDLTGSGTFSIFYSQLFPVSATLNFRGAGYWQGRLAVQAGGKIRAQILGATNGYASVGGFLLVN